MENTKRLRLAYVGMAMLLHNMIAIFSSLIIYAIKDDIPNFLCIILSVFLYLISFAVPFFLVALKYPFRIRSEQLIERHVPTGTLYSAFAVMGISYVASEAGQIVLQVLSYFNIKEVASEIVYTRDVTSFFLYFLYFVIIAPIVEEIFYRGVILQTMMPFGSGAALLFSTLFFALSHSTLSGVLYAFVSGLFIGALVIRYKSLKVGIIIHFINNFITFVLSSVIEFTGGVGERIINFVFPLSAVLCGIWWFFTFGRYLFAQNKGERYGQILMHPPILLYFIMATFIFITGFLIG